MKKLYVLLFMMTAYVSHAQVIISDNFDSYTTGALGPQATHWTTWSGAEGGNEDGTVTAITSFSAPHSMLIAEGGTQDVLLLLGNETSGVYTIRWQMRVDSGNTGYWNIQQNEIPAIQWNGEFYIGNTGTGGSAGVITYTATGTTPATIPYPENVFFEIVQVVDLTNLTLTVTINGNMFLNAVPYTGTALGAINFYSAGASNRYYVDNVLYEQGNTLSAPDFEENSFSIYPNPVKDVLSIKSQEEVSEISVYNVLGQRVYQSRPNRISPTVPMHSLKSGIYMVEVTIGKTTKVVKVIK